MLGLARRRSSVQEEMEGVPNPNVAGLMDDDAVPVVEERIVVCGACDNGSCSHLIAKRARFNDDEHGLNCVSPRKIWGDGIGWKSEMGSLNENKGVMLTMGSIVNYSRRPAPEICWRGSIDVLYKGANKNIGKFKAQFPLKVTSRVCDTVKMLPSNLQLELLPRMKDWPKSFETIDPVHEDIGVFFFFDKPDGRGKKHSNLLQESSNYVLRAYIGCVKLLIYSSEVLPPDSQWIDGENYLWGLFVRPKGKSDPWQFGSTST